MKNKILQFIPFSITVLLVLIHFFEVLTLNENGSSFKYGVLDSVFYASIGLVLIVILIILKQNIWKLVFLGLILLSFTPFIAFYNQTFSIGIGALNIELTSFVLLILHSILNIDMFAIFSTNVNETSDCFENNVKRFEKKFKSKDNEELKQIINENSLVPEALEAARRLAKKEG